MCGRFSLAIPAERIAELFKTAMLETVRPRYNISPTLPVLGIATQPDTKERRGSLFHWGLIPFWAKDKKISAKLTNARCETLAEKPSFRAAYKYRRCLIPVDGFYEWKREDGRKQPYYFTMTDGEPFAFAGLWEHWSGPAGEELQSCTIVTTRANRLMEPIHHRMPVILEPSDFDFWLDPRVRDPKRLNPLLEPYAGKGLSLFPVSSYVNKAGNEGPQCRTPIEPAEDNPNGDQQMKLF